MKYSKSVSADHPLRLLFRTQQRLLNFSVLIVLTLSVFFAQASRAGEVTLNLKDADIEALIGTVAEVTGKNFVIDPRVKGKVTVVSSTPMDESELYEVFLSILKVHGMAAVPSGSVIKIVLDANAKSDAVSTASNSSPGSGDQFVTRVVEINNVPATQLVPILRPLVPQQGHLAAYPPSNVLIISDRAANVARIVSIIRRIDLASTAEIDILALEYASATEIVRIINQLEPHRKKGDASSQTKLVADERTNSVLLSGDKASRLRMRAIITHLDTPLETGGNTQVVYLRYANATELVDVLQGVSDDIAAAKQSAIAGKGGAKSRKRKAAAGVSATIRADASMNALVITSPPDLFRSLQNVIRKLDVRRAQVMVEAIIAEISTDTTAQLGVQWGYTGNAADNSAGFGGTNFSTPGTTSLAAAAANPIGSISNGISLGLFDGTTTILGQEFLNIGALVQALKSDVDTNILSTPSLVTLDNEEAEFISGQNVPFITGSFTSTGASDSATNPFQTIERQDVGITLRIKPQINEGNAIKLDIFQEVSSVASSTAGADLTTNKRSIQTSVIVEDGQMLVLGGLMDDSLDENIQKVPLLGDIPLLGNLFKSRSTRRKKTNLMVFLHTRILRDPTTQATLSMGKYNQFRADQMARQSRGVNLMPGDQQPLLPELDIPVPSVDSEPAGMTDSPETAPGS